MSRLQDSIIDDDEESCPLCIEEFDLTDKNFKPCPCGYQICQFCFNSLKNTYEKSTCPNCRRVYDEKTIQFKIPSKEDIVHDKENKARKQAATRRKEGEKREVETSNRRNLAGVRVKQQNLVYVIGLVPSVKDESTLLQTLRGSQYFGQYGEIDKIVVSKAKPGSTSQGIGVYITYATREAAALCIEVVDGSMNGDRVLRAQYGTTKYCSAYLRGENCNNKSCTFLHETGEEGHGTTLQNEPSRPKNVGRPTQNSQVSNPQTAARNAVPNTLAPAITSQPMRRESSKENTKSRTNNTDTSALPSTASWANRDPAANATQTRRSSHPRAKSSSPKGGSAAQPIKKVDDTDRQTSTGLSQAQECASTSTAKIAELQGEKRVLRPPSPTDTHPFYTTPKSSLFDKLVTNVNTPSFRFSFDEKAFSNEELAALERCPAMIDPYGGAKRRLMREKEAERLQQQLDAQARLHVKSTAGDVADEENVEAGSLALGGEPEEGARKFSSGSAIQRPTQLSNVEGSFNDQFLDVGANSRNLTSQQRQQLAQLGSANIQQAPGLGQAGHQGFNVGNLDDQRLKSSQNQHYDSTQGHARQSSRYSFANDSVKPNPAPRFSAPQQQSAPNPQQFYASGVQGPPPGLKAAGTPPVSGGGMFAQGHGFTSNMSAGFGSTKDANAEMLMRGRSGTGSGHEASKRGGVVDLADPSILQARLHQNVGVAGQGLFGSQSQVDQDFPPLAAPKKPPEPVTATSKSQVPSVQRSADSPVRSSTPRVPPGLSLPHAHPSPFADDHETRGEESKASTISSGLVAPVLPVLPVGQPGGASKVKESDSPDDSKSDLNARSDQSASLQAPGHNRNTVDANVLDNTDNATTVGDIEPEVPVDASSQERSKKQIFARPEALDTSNAPQDVLDQPLPNQKAMPQLEKLDISAAIGERVKMSQSSSKSDHNVELHDANSLASKATSVSFTPTASTTKSPDWTPTSRPRTLRLTTTTTTKPSLTPASAATERSGKLSAGASKQASRQGSSSPVSQSRPSTPGISEHGTSADMSRAGSPAVSVFDRGTTVPARSRGKATSKKERKPKSEVASESKNEASPVPTPQISEEIGPIISRQKKKKKTQERDHQAPSQAKSTSIATAKNVDMTQSDNNSKARVEHSTTGDISAPVQDELISEPGKLGKKSQQGEGKDDVKPNLVEESPTIECKVRKSYTLRDLINDASQLPDTETPIADQLNKSITATSVLLREALETKDIDLDTPLFNAPPLSSYKLAPDPRKGAEYLEANGYAITAPFGEIYLSSHNRKHLLQGRDFRHSDLSKPQNLLKRSLITPSGGVFRHLTIDEEAKVLELERRITENEERFGDTISIDLQPLDALDFMNLTGGLQELMAFPALHRIGLLTAEPRNEGMEEDEDAEFGASGSDETEDDMAPLASGFGAAPEVPMRKPMSPSMMRRKADALLTVNLRNMDTDKLQKRIRETQVEMEGARKEAEALEKRAARKAKDVTRWREGLLKEMGRSSGGA